MSAENKLIIKMPNKFPECSSCIYSQAKINSQAARTSVSGGVADFTPEKISIKCSPHRSDRYMVRMKGSTIGTATMKLGGNTYTSNHFPKTVPCPGLEAKQKLQQNNGDITENSPDNSF